MLEVTEAPLWMFFICDGCQQRIPEDEKRFRCADCWDFDYCEGCFLRTREVQHVSSHAFYVTRGSMRLPQRNLVGPDTLVEPVFLPKLISTSMLPHLVALEREAFGGNAWGEEALVYNHSPSDRTYVQGFVTTQRKTGEQHLVGYICFSFRRQRMHLKSIAIKAEWQGAGLGRLVFRHALVQAVSSGDTVGVDLHVEETNARAFNMYLSHGFNVVSEHPEYYGPARHAFGMHLALRDGACDPADAFQDGIPL